MRRVLVLVLVSLGLGRVAAGRGSRLVLEWLYLRAVARIHQGTQTERGIAVWVRDLVSECCNVVQRKLEETAVFERFSVLTLTLMAIVFVFVGERPERGVGER